MGSPVPEGRGGIAVRFCLLGKPRSLVAFLGKAGYSDHFLARPLTPALRDGADLESSLTGAEAKAPAYSQAVPPGRYVYLPKRCTCTPSSLRWVTFSLI